MRRAQRVSVITVMAAVFILAFGAPAFAPCHIGSFVGQPYRTGEGAESVTITYSNGAGAQPGGSVDYRTVDGTARSGEDYAGTRGTLTWGSLPAAAAAAGVNPAHRSFSVPILQDDVDEADETFTLQMSNFEGCFHAEASDKAATVTITDDDDVAVKAKHSSAGGQEKTSEPQDRTPEQTSTPRQAQGQPSKGAASQQPDPAPSERSRSLAAPDETGGGVSGAVVVAGVLAAAVAASTVTRLLKRRRV